MIHLKNEGLSRTGDFRSLMYRNFMIKYTFFLLRQQVGDSALLSKIEFSQLYGMIWISISIILESVSAFSCNIFIYIRGIQEGSKRTMETMAYWNVTSIFKFVYWSWEKCVCVCVCFGEGGVQYKKGLQMQVLNLKGKKVYLFVQVELSKLRKYEVLVQILTRVDQ